MMVRGGSGVVLGLLVVFAAMYLHTSMQRLESVNRRLLDRVGALEATLTDMKQDLRRLSPNRDGSVDILDEKSRRLSHAEPNTNEVKEQVERSEEAQDLGTNTIHFIYGLWDKGEMPKQFKDTVAAWRRVNPAWSIKVWSGEEVKALWRDKFKEYRHIWKKAKPIQRADIARLMILLAHGGLYADLDCVPSRPIDDVLDQAGFRFVQHDAVVCLEDDKSPEQMAHTARWPIRKGVPEYHRRVANYVLWAKPGAKLVEDALRLAIHRVETTDSKFYHVQGRPELNNPYAIIYTTGPDALTEAVFPRSSTGPRKTHDRTMVIGEGKCYMTNKATGTWIGDKHPAWGQHT